ncbi:hypothetical protein MMC12_007380 [Toensbergia leucococca]|nr:hypothetical protein [Toensbergia leucococca]
MASLPSHSSWTAPSASDRIKALNDIDKVCDPASPYITLIKSRRAHFLQDVTNLLRFAGLAIKSLTTETSDSQSHTSSLMEKQKPAFIDATSQYFSLLSSIDVNLRRQIYALEEADIITADVASKDSQTNVNSAVAGEKAARIGSGLGNFDVGWLNSRNDKVGKEMEAELWSKAREMVSRLEERRDKENEDVDMEHDGVFPVAS